MRSPYEVLGVKPDASADDIRRAYRALAKQFHPDLNPGNAEAELRFKEIGTANEILSDPDKRARFDRGEIDEAGVERPPQQFYRGFAEGAEGARYHPQDAMHPEDLEDLFANYFSAGERGSARFQMRGADHRYSLTIAFLEAVNGATKRITLPDGASLDVTIAPGLADGQTLRLRGKGGPATGDAAPGDALVEVHVAPHQFFQRRGRDIHVDLPVTIAEAVLGAKITAPTVIGPVTLTIPPRSDSGKVLRLRGRGVPAHGTQPAGDQYVTLVVTIGPEPDQALEDFLKAWAPTHARDPRAAMVAP